MTCGERGTEGGSAQAVPQVGGLYGRGTTYDVNLQTVWVLDGFLERGLLFSRSFFTSEVFHLFFFPSQRFCDEVQASQFSPPRVIFYFA